MGNSKNLVDKVMSGAKTFVDNTRQYVGNIADGLKDGARDLAVYAVVGAVSLGAGARVASADTPINSFADFNPGAHVSNPVGMQTGTNLSILETVPPASIVEGYNRWHMGFINYSGDEAEVVGYADNKSELYPGKVYGKYFDQILGFGNKPDDVYIVNDGNGDGMGYVTPTGEWFLGQDDRIFYSGEVMFGPNKIYGDVNQLPMLVTSGPMYLPAMEVDARVSRTGPAGMNELLDLTGNWLRQDCHPYDNNDCDGADWNYDRQVNFIDFSHMANGWE